MFSVRYIALDEEADRISFMDEWLRSVFGNLDLSRMRGIRVADNESVPFYNHLERLNRFGYGLTASEVGCFLAHRNCWVECCESKTPMLIMESDVAPRDLIQFRQLLENLLVVDSRFDLVRLHGVFERNELCGRRLATIHSDWGLFQTLGDPMGSAAYLVKPNAAGELLRASESFFQPVDVFLASTWLHKQRFRSVKPWPMVSQDFPSEIGERRRPKQSFMQRMLIEMNRAKDDIRRICYLPRHFFR